jgi:hypothetical protein
VANGNIDVGNKTPTRKPGQPTVENSAVTGGSSDKPAALKKERPSAAMAQQCGDSGRGNQSAPQKFLQLVGYRDPNARHEPWVRPRPAPQKR